jgi:hypothetical protein
MFEMCESHAMQQCEACTKVYAVCLRGVCAFVGVCVCACVCVCANKRACVVCLRCVHFVLERVSPQHKRAIC